MKKDFTYNVYNVVRKDISSSTVVDNFIKTVASLSEEFDNSNIDTVIEKAKLLNALYKQMSINPMEVSSVMFNDSVPEIKLKFDAFINNILNVSLNKDNFTKNSPYRKLVLYIQQYQDDEPVYQDKLMLIDDKKLPDDKYINNFIDSFNNIIQKKTLQSVLQFIAAADLFDYYKLLVDKEKGFEEIDLPLKIYNKLNDSNNLSFINDDYYKSVYEDLLSALNKKSDNSFLDIYSEKITTVLKPDGFNEEEFIKDLSKEKIDLGDDNIFKRNDLNVKSFLTKAIATDEIITTDMYNKWNESFTNIINGLLSNIQINKNVVEDIKQSFNINVPIVINMDNGLKENITIRRIITDINENIYLLRGKFENEEVPLGEGMILEFEKIFKEFNVKVNIKEYMDFFKSMKNLLSDDENEIKEFFIKWFGDDCNMETCFNAIKTWLINEKIYPYITSYYVAKYINLTGKQQ